MYGPRNMYQVGWHGGWYSTKAQSMVLVTPCVKQIFALIKHVKRITRLPGKLAHVQVMLNLHVAAT
jgi:hypothetical protein